MKKVFTLFLVTLQIGCTGDRANNLLQKGLEKYNRGDFISANEYFIRAVNINPNLARAYYCMAIIKNETGDPGGAVEDYSKAIEINPLFQEAYFNRGLIRYELQNHIGAISDMKHVISIDPQNWMAYGYKGLFEASIGNLTMACIDYDKSISINNKSGFVFLCRGEARWVLEDYEGAKKDATRCLACSEDMYYARAYNLRGRSNFFLEQHHDAINDYSNAISLDPENSNHYLNRSFTKFAIHDTWGAINDITKVIEINPMDGDPYYRRGRIYLSLGLISPACADFKKAAELGFYQAYKDLAENCK